MKQETTEEEKFDESLAAELAEDDGGSGQRILVLDDDQYFRDLVKQILLGHGYTVMEARNAKEAFQLISRQKPHLAIVDYRLPGMDGITWIENIREAGFTFPIIFVSGTWCDAKMFNHLRNLLGVSLIMQKPITQEVLAHSIEMILPDQNCSSAHHNDQLASCCGSSGRYEHLLQGCSAEEALVQLKSFLSLPDLDPRVTRELQDLSKRIKTQKLVAGARASYIERLPSIWTELATTINAARGRFSSGKSVNDAIDLSHKIKGSAGSYGITEIAGQAQLIEQCLRSLDFEPNPVERDLIWQEILGYVSDGEYTVEQLVQAGAAAPPPRKDAAMKLIALAPAMDRNMLDESCRAVGFTVDHAPDLHSVFSNQRLYDAALLDLHCVPPQNIYNIVGALRTTSGASAQMPFALIASNDAPLTLPDLIYTGCSAYIEQPDDSQCVGDALRFLWKDSNNAKQHVLCIDDDPMLTKFVDSVLSGAGYSVKSITEPITVLDVLEEFTPDLIVLDVVMPGLTGYEVCRMLRAHERWSHVPIIFLTCKSNAAGRAAAFEAGGTDFLAKPVLAEELLARINMHLALQESKRSFVGLLPKDQFEKQSQILAKNSQKSGLPSTLVLVQIAEPNLVAQTGPAGMDHVAPMLEQLLALRFRQSDLRCKWSNGLYAVFMPGLDADCAQDVLGCLCSDWLHIWSMDKNANMNRLNVSAAAMNGSSRSIADLVEEAGLSLRNVVEIAGEIVTRKETQLDCSWR